MRLALLIFLLFASTAAKADPVTAAVAWAAATFAVSTATVYLVAATVLLTVGTAVYGSAQARRAERDARNAMNAAMQDRMATRIASESPHRYIYGRAKVGSDIVAMFTSGDKDQYKHIVCVLAAHECDAVEEVYVNHVAIGLSSVTAAGDVTGGRYVRNPETNVIDELHTGPTFTLSTMPLAGSVSAYVGTGPQAYEVAVNSVTGRTVTVAHTGDVMVSYEIAVARRFGESVDPTVATPHTPYVRVQVHLGTPTDPADAYLMSVMPGKWPSTAVLRGLCYLVVTLDLNNPEFQGGQVPIQALVRGRKLYDPRTGATVWSANPALAIRDYLTSVLCGVPASDLSDAQFITAANVCDDASVVAGGRYTINGTVTSDQDQSHVLEAMAQCMAGGIVSTSWDIYAGNYVAPVAALQQSDIVGAISITPSASDAAIYNGVKGQFLSDENDFVLTDFKPYQNDTYRAADGRDLYTNIDFPFTSSLQRVTNLSRIFTEDQRNGFTLKAEFSLKAWPLKVGQRVTFTSAFLGQTAKVYRITDKSYAPNSAVELTLKEDAADIWDFADAVTLDSTPNTDLPDPWEIAPLASLSCTSGISTLLRQADGSIIARILASWPAVITQAVFTNGVIEIEWRALGTDTWQTTSVSGSETQAFLAPITPGWFYNVRGRTVNPYLNTKSDWIYQTFRPTVASANPTVFQWSPTRPVVPSGLASFNWPSATFGAAPAGWSLTEPVAPSGTTSTLWAARALVSDTDTSGATSFDWATALITSVGFTSPAGATGPSGNQFAAARLYQWSSAAPAAPTGTSTFTWATGVNSAYSAGDGWNVAAPANPGTPGVRLYVAEKPITAPGGAVSSNISYSGASISAWAQNGTNGVSGVQSAIATVYQWAATIPAGPVGAATFTWPASFGAAPSGYTLAPGAGTPGYTLWAARVLIIDTAGVASTAFSWTSASVTAAGYAGGNGAEGASYVTAYCASSVGTGTSAPAPTTGKTSVPAPNSGGITGTYSAAVPALSAGQYQMQVDGIYSPVTNQVTWSIPYQSSAKFGSLSAITANMGQITAGSIDIGTGAQSFHVDAAGNQWSGASTFAAAPYRVSNTGAMFAKNLTLGSTSGATIIDPTTGLQPGFEAPGTKNSDQTLGALGFTGDTNANFTSPSKGAALNDDPAVENPGSWNIPAGITTPTGNFWTPQTGLNFFYAVDSTSCADKKVFSKRAFAIDAARTYSLFANLFADVGNNRPMFLIVDMFDGSGTRVATSWGGSFSGYTFGDLLPNNGHWNRCGGKFGAGTGQLIPAAARTAVVGVWFQYSGIGSSNGSQAAQDIRLLDITEVFLAQASADAANAKSDAVAADGILDRSEKTDLISTMDAEAAKYASLVAQATALGVSTAAYTAARDARDAYLVSLDDTGAPAWNDVTANTPIDRPTYRAKFTDYYREQMALINANAAKAATMANWTGGIANRPSDAALLNSAVSVTSDGQLVGAGGGRITSIPSVDKGNGSALGCRDHNDAPVEFPIGETKFFKYCSAINLTGSSETYCTLQTIKQYTDASGGGVYQYAYAGVTTWRRYAPNPASTDPANFGAWVQDLDRAAYTGALNATVNVVTSSATAPSSPNDGDIWVNTNTPITIQTRVAGAWVVGGNVPTALTHVDPAAATKLTSVAAGATANVLSTGLLSARPAGNNGDIYYATDTKIQYNKTAGAWVAAANNYTNTNQLIDGAGLGSTAVWSQVSGTETIISDVATAKTNAADAVTAVADKLSKTAASILSAAITLSTGGAIQVVNGNKSVTIDGSGIAFVVGGVAKITLDTATGAATFAGDVTSGGSIVGVAAATVVSNASTGADAASALANRPSVSIVTSALSGQRTNVSGSASRGSASCTVTGGTGALSYLWSITIGDSDPFGKTQSVSLSSPTSSSTGVSAALQNDSGVSYTLNLVVTDSKGLSGSASVQAYTHQGANV